MKPILLIISLVLLPAFAIFAQKPAVNIYAAIDKKALQLPDSLTKTTDGIASYVAANFSADKEKARAIFIWIASNIQYDIDNIFAINRYATTAEIIAKTLTTRKAICQGYAETFQELCKQTGIKCFVVTGYTKQSGFVDYIQQVLQVCSTNKGNYILNE